MDLVKVGRTLTAAGANLGLALLGLGAPAIFFPAPASARDDTHCMTGFVARRTSPDDDVCVPPDSRARAQAENARAPLLWTPGPYGPYTCVIGFVWRQAGPLDHICVIPAIRTLVQQENGLAASRRLP